jgi:type VI protein secretion system component Hcp
MPSDAFMELETRDLIGETFDAPFGMAQIDPKISPRRQGAFGISDFGFSVQSNRKDREDEAPATQQPTTGPNRTVSNTPVRSNAGSGGSSTGKEHPTVREFTITKSIDKASTRLFLLCCERKKIDWAVISLREAGSDPKTSGKAWLIMEFTDVYVDDFKWALKPDEGGEDAETVTFRFEQVLIKYYQQEASGAHKPVSTGGWNRYDHNREAKDWGSETW